jgi:hypothetical protein
MTTQANLLHRFAPLKSLNQNISKKKNLSIKSDNMLILGQNATGALYSDDLFHICTTNLVIEMLKGCNCVNIMLIGN